jgi:transposase
LARYLVNYRNSLFLYLDIVGLEATNWPAEQALRFAVITRKTCGGGNRTDAGAESLAVWMSILQAARTARRNLVDVVTALLRGRTPDLLPSAR